MRAIVVLVVLASLVSTARAHSGGLDGSGCHTDASTGAYHCHRMPGQVDPAVMYGLGYAITGLSIAVLIGLSACGRDCHSSLWIPGLGFVAAEALAIAGLVLENGASAFIDFGVLTGLNIAGGIGAIVAAFVLAPPQPSRPPIVVDVGVGTLAISGTF